MRCKCYTQKNRKCKRNAIVGGSYCYQHIECKAKSPVRSPKKINRSGAAKSPMKNTKPVKRARGANVNQALIDAVKANNLGEVRRLVEIEGASLSARDRSNGNNPLHIAASLYDLPMVKYLVGAGADIEAKNKREGTPLIIASLISIERPNKTNAEIKEEIKRQLTVIKFLIDSGANIEEKLLNEYTPLQYAAGTKQYEVVKLLLKEGANPYAPSAFSSGKNIKESVKTNGDKKMIDIFEEYTFPLDNKEPEYL